MRKAGFIENCRCYHLISRLAHRAFFLDDGEKTRAVELLRRVEVTLVLLARTDPDHPKSPQQRYCLA